MKSPFLKNIENDKNHNFYLILKIQLYIVRNAQMILANQIARKLSQSAIGFEVIFWKK